MWKVILFISIAFHLCMVAESLSTGKAPGINYCDLKCRDITEDNSACKCEDGTDACGGEAPKILTPDVAMRQYIIDGHNKLREQVASGNEMRGGNIGGATDIRKMEYDTELEYVAECHNRKCILDHDKCRLTNRWKGELDQVGQNQYDWAGRKICDNYDIDLSHFGWYDEVRDASLPCLQNYTICPHHIGHYTQLTWAKSFTIGCSLVQFKQVKNKEELRVCSVNCNYGPAGNWGGDRVYTLGPPARDCKENDTTYPHLCIGEVVSGDHDLTYKPPGNGSAISTQKIQTFGYFYFGYYFTIINLAYICALQ